MANETFPIQTSTQDGSTLVVGQLDLSELEGALAPRLADPPDGFNPKDASRPDPAKPTAGPHRYTIYVPENDQSRINVGAAHPIWGESGVSIDTRSHFHVSTYGLGWGSSYLSLGSPPTVTGFPTNQKTAGYAMHTAGASNHVALWQVGMTSVLSGMTLDSMADMNLASSLGRVGIHAGAGVNVGTPGPVTISAGTAYVPDPKFWSDMKAMASKVADHIDFSNPALGIAKSAIMNPAQAAEDFKDVTNFVKDRAIKEAKAYSHHLLVSHYKKVDLTLKHVKSVAALVLKFKKTQKEVKAGKAQWTKKEIGKTIFAWGKEAWSIYKDFSKSSDEKANAGDVSIDATGKIRITANDSAALTGVNGVTVSGFKKASVSSISSSMQGHKEASVWGGLGASVKSLAGDVTLTSDLKGITIGGKKDVKIASEAAGATLTGETDVQLNSISRQAYIHGKLGFYIGCGTGPGCGVVAAEEEIWIGELTQATSFPDAMVQKDKAHARFNKKQTAICFGTKQQIRMGKDGIGIRAKAGNMHVTAKEDMNISGKKVLLG